MKIEAKLSGLKEVENKFSQLANEFGPVNQKALKTIAADLKGKAVRLAPVETGDLRGSAWYKVKKVGGGYEATVGFTEPYALIQHERLDFNHPKGGQAKYLEAPFTENLKRYIQLLADANKKVGD